MSAFSSCSSLRSRAEFATLSESFLIELDLHEREIADLVRSKASCNWEPRGGTKRATTREETKRFFLRLRRARIRSCGCSIKSATAAISSSAYPGSFANR